MFPGPLRTRVLIAAMFLALGVAFLMKALSLPSRSNSFYVEADGRQSLSSQALLATMHARIRDILDRGTTPQPILLLHNGNEVTKFEVGLSDMNGSRIFISPDMRDFRRAVLVRSTDENRQPVGETAEPIAVGCGLGILPPIEPTQLSPIVTCRGPYSAENIVGVADVVVRPWNSNKGQCDPDCVKDNVQITLSPLIQLVRNLKKTGNDALVLPAIGTGFGGMSPSLFYASFANEYSDTPTENPNGAATIVFSVYTGAWQQNRVAIQDPLAEALKTIAGSWQEKMAASEKIEDGRLERLRSLISISCGVCFGMVMLLLMPAPKRANASADLRIGWLFASVLGYLMLSFPVAFAIVNWLTESANTMPHVLIDVLIGVITVPLVLLVKNFQAVAEAQIKQVAPVRVKDTMGEV